jgi:hypothetical protein
MTSHHVYSYLQQNKILTVKWIISISLEIERILFRRGGGGEEKKMDNSRPTKDYVKAAQ